MASKLPGRLVLLAVLVGMGASTAAAPRHASESPNPANAKLLTLAPGARAAMLAKAIGHWCVGTEAFAMGVSTTGRGAGDAYWSLRCADGSAWAVQIDPLGEFSAMDCAAFDTSAGGNKCFEKIHGPNAGAEEKRR